MKIRDANIADAKAIHAMVTYYAEFDRMLFRSMPDIYESFQTFKIAEEEGRVVGCCALQVIWSDLAELKSLAVDKEFAGRGIGKSLHIIRVGQYRLGDAGTDAGDRHQ